MGVEGQNADCTGLDTGITIIQHRHIQAITLRITATTPMRTDTHVRQVADAIVTVVVSTRKIVIAKIV